MPEQMPEPTTEKENSARQLRTAALMILVLCGILALLVVGRGFLVPIVIAALLTSLISSGISKLERHGLPAWAAMTVSVSGFFGLIYGLAQIFSSQISSVSDTLPKYSGRLEKLLAGLTEILGEKQVGQIQMAIENTDFTAHATSIAESVGGLFGDFGLVLMYCGFLIAERGQLVKKLGYLFPDPDRSNKVQSLLRTVGAGIKRYMAIKTAVSVLTGTLCFVVLKYVGVDFAEILALLIFLLNFIPSVGSIVGVILPAIVSLVQFDTITPFLTVVALCGSIQFVVGNVIEPRYLGTTLNLSPFVVLVSLTFWGTVWGIEGAFLSVPITASIIILCRDIPSVRGIAILLSADGDVNKGRKPNVEGTPGNPEPDVEKSATLRKLQDELSQLRKDESTPDGRKP